MTEKIVSLAEINAVLASAPDSGRNACSKLRRAFEACAREDAVYFVMRETEERRFFIDREPPAKGPLAKLFSRKAVYCTMTAFQEVVDWSGLAPAAKLAALKAASEVKDRVPDMARGGLVPYPAYIGFSG
jgi:hypothetical protein